MIEEENTAQDNSASLGGWQTMRPVLMLCAGVFMACALVSLAGIGFLTGLLSGPFGVFANLSLFLYLFAGFIIIQGARPLLSAIRAQDGKIPAAVKTNLIKTVAFVVFCLFMAAESVEWFVPLFAQDGEKEGIHALRQALVAAFLQTPEKIDLDSALLIAGTRFFLLAGLAYGAAYLVYKGKQAARHLEDPFFVERAQSIGVFLGLFILGIIFRLIGGTAGAVFAGGADLCAALYVLAYVLERHYTQNKRPHSHAASSDTKKDPEP